MPGGSSTKVKSLPLKNKKSGDHRPDKTNKKKDLPMVIFFFTYLKFTIIIYLHNIHVKIFTFVVYEI